MEDDTAFLAVIELAIDWGLEITEEQWKRYCQLLDKEDAIKEKLTT